MRSFNRSLLTYFACRSTVWEEWDLTWVDRGKGHRRMEEMRRRRRRAVSLAVSSVAHGARGEEWWRDKGQERCRAIVSNKLGVQMSIKRDTFFMHWHLQTLVLITWLGELYVWQKLPESAAPNVEHASPGQPSHLKVQWSSGQLVGVLGTLRGVSASAVLLTKLSRDKRGRFQIVSS